MTLQNSLEKGIAEFLNKCANDEFGYPITQFQRAAIADYLATFARTIAKDALEAVKLEEMVNKRTDFEDDFDRGITAGQLIGFNQAVQTQQQLSKDYLNGKEKQ